MSKSPTTASDPRRAATLGEACANGDGTFNAIRGLSWLSEALHPGRGLPVEEVERIAEQVKARRAGAPPGEPLTPYRLAELAADRLSRRKP